MTSATSSIGTKRTKPTLLARARQANGSTSGWKAAEHMAEIQARWRHLPGGFHGQRKLIKIHIQAVAETAQVTSREELCWPSPPPASTRHPEQPVYETSSAGTALGFPRQTKAVKNRAAYQRGYNRAWKQARRARLIDMLGGCCVRCGATEDLEFDHIDPSTKVFAICAGLSKAWDVLVEEASKTQLLCKPCHVAKGAEDRPELRHGTYHVYWYWNCRCQECKAANARKSAALRAKRQNVMPATSERGALVTVTVS